MFNRNDVKYGYELNGGMGSTVKNEEYFVSDYIKVYPGQKLYKSGSSAGTSNCFYDENKNFISTVRLVDGVISVPTTNSISYMRTNGLLTDLDSIQITSGDTQSTYEAYIEPKIFIKNDNNIYEEFTKKQEENYSKQERIIGTWIDGKPLYRRVYQSSEFLNRYYISMNNVDTIVDINGMVKRSDYDIYCKIPYRTGEASWNTSFGNINIYNNRIETDLLYGSSFSTTNFSSIVITVEYTKTTD